MDQANQYLELFTSEAQKYLTNLENLTIYLEKNLNDSEILIKIMQNAHSLKGIAATINFDDIASLAHSLESLIANYQQFNIINFTFVFALLDEIKNLIDFHAHPEKSKSLFKEKSQVVKTLIQGWNDNLLIKHNFDYVNIKVDYLDQLLARLRKLAASKTACSKDGQEEIAILLTQLEHFRFVPLEQIFRRFKRVVRDLASIQGKTINLVIQANDLSIDSAMLGLIDIALIHLVRNAIDHGIEETGQIVFSAKKVSQQLMIKIHDDGQGINWQKVEQKMQQAHYQGKKEDFLFSGITTAHKVTTISGRGLGLSYLKDCLDQVSGKITVESTPQTGTTFIIFLPLDKDYNLCRIIV